MQELMQTDGSETKLRLTVFAGMIIGLLVGSAAVSIAAYIKIAGIESAKASAIGDVTLQYETKLKVAQQAQADLAASMPCAIIPAMAAQRISAIERLQKKVAEFPQFKTEPFKSVYADVSKELGAQSQSVRSLMDNLKGEGDSAAKPCRLHSTSTDGSVAIWSDGYVSLFKDGWKVESK